jgi:hypothetical protein
LGDVHSLVLARRHLQAVLASVGSDAVENAHESLERLVERLFAELLETTRPSQVLVLEDPVTRVQVVLTADLPTVPYRRLAALDLSLVVQCSVRDDPQRGGWRHGLYAWQHGELLGSLIVPEGSSPGKARTASGQETMSAWCGSVTAIGKLNADGDG